MDEFLFISICILILVGVPIGIACLLYYVPKKLDYQKTGKYLSLVFGLMVLTFVLWTLFEDQLFSKSRAKELVAEQQIFLQDQFEIKENKSSSAIGDYYHTFTLAISPSDRENAISKIKQSKNFKTINEPLQDLLFTKERYFGKKIMQNYESEYAFVREYFEPSGEEGYAPTFRKISISKTENELQFEDRVE